jgi:hypothetical protein
MLPFVSLAIEEFCDEFVDRVQRHYSRLGYLPDEDVWRELIADQKRVKEKEHSDDTTMKSRECEESLLD